jgi:hypothetical protein
VAGALQADEFGDLFEVHRKHVLFALRDDRHGAQAEGLQFFTAARVIDDVDGDVVDAFFRKKLFRSKTAASPGLGKEYEFVAGIHACPVELISANDGRAYYPPRNDVKQCRHIKRAECAVRDGIISA